MARISAVILSAAALSASCGLTETELEGFTQGLRHQCQTSADCGDEMQCTPHYKVCVTASPEPLTVSVVAEPPDELGLAASHVGDITVSPEASQVDVRLPHTVTIKGRVRSTANLLDSALEATVLAVAAGQVVEGEFITSKAIAQGPFELFLAAGVPYTVRIDVNGAGWPPFVTEVTFHEDSAHTFWLPETYLRLAGRVTQVQPDGAMPNRLQGVRVTAVNATTGQACTSAITGKLGDYELLCPTEGTYSVRVSPTEEQPLVPSFTAVIDGQDRFELSENTTEGGLRVLDDIIIGAQARETEVSIFVRDASGEDLEGVEITVWSTLDADNNSLWRSSGRDVVIKRVVSTDNGGQARVSLLKDADYSVAVTPHPSSPLASVIQTDWDVTQSPTKQITLLPKPSLTGTVSAYSGAPARHARVVATTMALDPVTGTEVRREYSSETDETGRFQLGVDPGSYTLEVVPEESSAQPRFQATELLVSEDTVYDIALARPALVEGTVLQPIGAGTVANARITIYSVSFDGKRPIFLGGGITDDDGRYVVILPAP